MAALVAAHPAAFLQAADDVESPVLRIILERARAGSLPRDRDDEHVVCLAVEGGGMRGAVSAGMCVVLEATGLIGAFDRIYGVSAGALNGWATAVGQAALSATHYQDAAQRRVINRMRPLLGRPVIDLDLLFEELIAARKPLSFSRLSSGPELCVLATSLETLSLRVLKHFTDLDEVTQAVRASAALPRLAGRPPVFRGERMLDGGLIEPIPFETAVTEGASHVLVLRTRPAGYRKPALRELGDVLAVRDDPGLLELVRARHGVYNRQAAALEHGPAARRGAPHVLQVTVPDRTRLIGRLESDAARVAEAVGLGATAMASTLLTEAIDLCWQPVVYRAAPAVRPARKATAAPRIRLRSGRRRGEVASTSDAAITEAV